MATPPLDIMSMVSGLSNDFDEVVDGALLDRVLAFGNSDEIRRKVERVLCEIMMVIVIVMLMVPMVLICFTFPNLSSKHEKDSTTMTYFNRHTVALSKEKK